MHSEQLRFAGHGGDAVGGTLVLPERATEGSSEGEGVGGLPAVLLVHEVFGVDDHMRDLAGGLAAQGFACLVPDLWAREGLPGPSPSVGDPTPAWPTATIRAAVAGLPDRRALGDLEAGLRTLAERPEVDPDRVAAMGCCMGGTLAFLLACTTRRPLAAVVDCYGRIVYRELTEAKPSQPLELALNLACPLLAQFGAADGSIPAEHVELLEQRLTMFSREFEIVVHPNAGHGFLNDTRPGYHAGAAEAAWARTLAFLRAHTADH